MFIFVKKRIPCQGYIFALSSTMASETKSEPTHPIIVKKSATVTVTKCTKVTKLCLPCGRFCDVGDLTPCKSCRVRYCQKCLPKTGECTYCSIKDDASDPPTPSDDTETDHMCRALRCNGKAVFTCWGCDEAFCRPCRRKFQMCERCHNRRCVTYCMDDDGPGSKTCQDCREKTGVE